MAATFLKTFACVTFITRFFFLTVDKNEELNMFEVELVREKQEETKENAI
jgi:hypothetical protein